VKFRSRQVAVESLASCSIARRRERRRGHARSRLALCRSLDRAGAAWLPGVAARVTAGGGGYWLWTDGRLPTAGQQLAVLVARLDKRCGHGYTEAVATGFLVQTAASSHSGALLRSQAEGRRFTVAPASRLVFGWAGGLLAPRAAGTGATGGPARGPPDQGARCARSRGHGRGAAGHRAHRTGRTQGHRCDRCVGAAGAAVQRGDGADRSQRACRSRLA